VLTGDHNYYLTALKSIKNHFLQLKLDVFQVTWIIDAATKLRERIERERLPKKDRENYQK
jgi:hypothetical protein